MKLMNILNRFKKDEDGAVTVDWVVLTAAIVGLGLVVFTFIQPKISDLASDIGDQIDAAGTSMNTSGSSGGSQ